VRVVQLCEGHANPPLLFSPPIDPTFSPVSSSVFICVDAAALAPVAKDEEAEIAGSFDVVAVSSNLCYVHVYAGVWINMQELCLCACVFMCIRVCVCVRLYLRARDRLS